MKAFRNIAAGALVAAASVTGAALAADMAAPPRVYAPVAVVQPCAWCGVYFGLNAGFGWGRSEISFIPRGFFNQDPTTPYLADFGSPTFNRNGFSGGGQIGINSQWFGFVAGLEIDFEHIGLRQDRLATFTSPISGPVGGTPEVFTFNDSFKNNLVSTQRLRLGWASDIGLIYITGGLALSQHTFSAYYVSPNFAGGGLAPGFTGIPVAGTGSVNHWTAGWSAGAGIEFKLTRNWSLRAEYLYIDLGKSQFDTVLAGTTAGGGGPIGAGFTAHHENHMRTAIARGAINYQFDWAPPFLSK